MRWRGYRGLYLPLPLLTKEVNRNAGFPIKDVEGDSLALCQV